MVRKRFFRFFLVVYFLLSFCVNDFIFSEVFQNNEGVQYEIKKLRDDILGNIYGLFNGRLIEWLGRVDEKPEEIHFIDENGVVYHKCKTLYSVMSLDTIDDQVYTFEKETYPSRARRDIMCLINEKGDPATDHIEWIKYHVRRYDDTKEIGETITELSHTNKSNPQLVAKEDTFFLLYMDSDLNKNSIILQIVNYPLSNLDEPSTLTVEFSIKKNEDWPRYKFHDENNLYFSRAVRNNLPDDFDKEYDYYGEVLKVNLYTGEISLFFREKNLNSIGIDGERNILYYQTLYYPPDAEDKYKSCLNFLYKLYLNQPNSIPQKVELPFVAGLWDNHLKKFLIRIPGNNIFKDPYSQGGYYMLTNTN